MYIFYLRYRLLQSRNKNSALRADDAQYLMKFCRRDDSRYRRALCSYFRYVLKYCAVRWDCSLLRVDMCAAGKKKKKKIGNWEKVSSSTSFSTLRIISAVSCSRRRVLLFWGERLYVWQNQFMDLDWYWLLVAISAQSIFSLAFAFDRF